MPITPLHGIQTHTGVALYPDKKKKKKRKEKALSECDSGRRTFHKSPYLMCWVPVKHAACDTHTQVGGYKRGGSEAKEGEGVIIEDDVYRGLCGMTASLSFL